jgi:hypothetical protein
MEKVELSSTFSIFGCAKTPRITEASRFRAKVLKRARKIGVFQNRFNPQFTEVFQIRAAVEMEKVELNHGVNYVTPKLR